MSENAEKFLGIFRDAVRRLPDQQVLVNWMIYTLGVMSVRSTEHELYLAEKEIYKLKPEVRH